MTYMTKIMLSGIAINTGYFDKTNDKLLGKAKQYTVDMVIFTCLNFHEFPILRLFTKFRIREFSFFFSSAFIIIIFAIFLNSRICPPR